MTNKMNRPSVNYPLKANQKKELKDNKRAKVSKRLMNRSKALLTRRLARSQNQPSLPKRAVLKRKVVQFLT